MSLEDAFDRGFKAGRYGESAKGNPYTSSEYRYEWLNGYFEGDSLRRKNLPDLEPVEASSFK